MELRSIIIGTPIMLIQNKFSVPPYQDNCIQRERLYQILDQYQSHRVTIVHAPAGFGKSTLVSQWVYERSLIDRVIWYQCDYTDQNNKQFIRYLAAAFDQYFQGCSAIVNAVLDTSHDTSSKALMELIAYINNQTIKSTMFLVFDDVHTIQTDDFKHLFTNICKYLTSAIPVIAISRLQHTISIPYLLLSQQVQSINANDMALDTTEMLSLLRTFRYPSPTSTQLQQILTYTEGWIAGIKLASQLNNQKSYTQLLQIFTHHEDTIINYLISEFLNTQPNTIQQFLLYSSMLEEFTIDLCTYTFNEFSFETALSGIDLSALFLFRIGKSKWYRFHHLIKSVLYNQLQIELSQTTQQRYHIRAAHWCIKHERIDLAIRHYIAANHATEILDILSPVLQQLMLHNPQQAKTWFDLLPVQETRRHLRLHLDQLFLAFMLEDPNIESLYDTVIRNHPSNTIPVDSVEHLELLFIESYIALRKHKLHNFEMMLTTLNHSIHRLPLHIQGSIEFMNMHYCIELHNISDALVHAQRSQSLFTQQKLHQGVISIQRELSTLLFHCGNAQASFRVSHDLFAYIQKHNLNISLDILISYLAITEAYFWSNKLNEAQQYHRILDNLAHTLRNERLIQLTSILSDYIAILNNEIKVFDANKIPTVFSELDIFGFHQLKWIVRIFTITQMSAKSIHYIFQQFPIHQDTHDSLQNHILQLLYIEAILNSSENCTQIGTMIEHLYTEYEFSELLFVKLHVMTLYTWYCHKQFDQKRVVPLLHNIIALVNETGYARFIFDYPVIKTLLHTHAIGSEFYANQSSLLIELTDSEQQILALLAQNLTYAEIASSLYISVNTVRFHVKNIYRKLGSNRRGLVIERAIQHNLIAPKKSSH